MKQLNKNQMQRLYRQLRKKGLSKVRSYAITGMARKLSRDLYNSSAKIVKRKYPYYDFDGDGKANRFDCRPFNKWRQDNEEPFEIDPEFVGMPDAWGPKRKGGANYMRYDSTPIVKLLNIDKEDKMLESLEARKKRIQELSEKTGADYFQDPKFASVSNALSFDDWNVLDRRKMVKSDAINPYIDRSKLRAPKRLEDIKIPDVIKKRRLNFKTLKFVEKMPPKNHGLSIVEMKKNERGKWDFG